MHIVVDCSHCGRQYDATGYTVGSRFRCHCSVILTVEAHVPAAPVAPPPVQTQAQSQAPSERLGSRLAANVEGGGIETAVVRCSACGAPRGDGLNCDHCGSSFARYERDRTGICPYCTSRVSEAARFCHGCGNALTGGQAIGHQTDMACPSCGSEHRMHQRELGPDLSLLECSRCAGLWLDKRTFEHVVRRAEEMITEVPAGQASGPPGGRSVAGAGTNSIRYRPCPVCNTLMNRSQYGRYSRVIVDTCKEHGVWLDEGELTQILEWVRDGGLERARQTRHEKRKDEIRMQMMQARFDQSNEDKRGGRNAYRGGTDSLLLQLFR
ncbi:hypothetical protein PPSIR1_02678 [Plesiocystis pacifica SIR-1]|uniref:Transcription factor zinc-finger domain-containing protein n=1 Tax=Plesiocystis pacifica SIR-1 TaxID=391625 RepID=A6GKF2_9BACT|nr:zf-TFIIB domain-containing protein [Plesiocystis pacifica]EDM73654.1 hypothetical protein PPSIR1_02678 [Plesiocystis pacifica SIR-1]